MDARLLAMALQAQKNFAASTHTWDEGSVKGKLIVLDMLDIIGKQIDEHKAKSAKEGE